jgi:hypothetical protein
MNKNFRPRIGTFFILVGCGFLVLFIGTVFAKESSIPFLLFAAAALFIGSIFHRNTPRPEPTRFSGIRKMRQRSHQRRENKQNKPLKKEQENDQTHSTR